MEKCKARNLARASPGAGYPEEHLKSEVSI